MTRMRFPGDRPFAFSIFDDTDVATLAYLKPIYEYLAEHRAIIGSPEQCIARIKNLEQQGIGYFVCNFFFGDMAHEKVIQSMKLFAKEVMPAFE